MTTVYLQQTSQQQGFGVSRITDQNGKLLYHIIGDFGRPGDQLQLIAPGAESHCKIVQTAAGFLPRFVLKLDAQELGSFGLSTQFRDLLVINHLNWLVIGNPQRRRYSVKNLTRTLARVVPTNNFRLQITYTDEKFGPAIILIIAFIDRWQTIQSQQRYPAWQPLFSQKLAVQNIKYHA